MQDRNIYAPDLTTAIRHFIRSGAYPRDNTYFVSMDHSPSEQLDYGGNAVHTTALVISSDMAHQQVADEIARELGLNRLAKWNKSRPKYRQKFHSKIFHILKKFNVAVVIFRATEENILKYEDYIVKDIGCENHYRRVDFKGKKRVEVGPFIDESGTPRTISISEKHAPVAAFTVSSLLRLYDIMQSEISEFSEASKLPPLSLNIFSDR